MSQAVLVARTNDFRVKSIQGLRESLTKIGFTLSEDGDMDTIVLRASRVDDGMVTLLAFGEFGSWPEWFDEETDDMQGGPEAVIDAVTENLAKDSVAVFHEICVEKMRYLGASAIAVNAQGEQESLFLDDIYDRARKRFASAEVLAL